MFAYVLYEDIGLFVVMSADGTKIDNHWHFLDGMYTLLMKSGQVIDPVTILSMHNILLPK